MKLNTILNLIKDNIPKILENNVIGIYLHGSIIFNDFEWDKSDIDFIVIVKNRISLQQKEKIISFILKINKYCPKKGLEMSIIQHRNINPFVYPTPFELHYSNYYYFVCKKNLKEFCQNMNGLDKDLATHCKLIISRGITLYGLPIDHVFSEVPELYFIDSIFNDIKDSLKSYHNNSYSTTLNLCRTIVYCKNKTLCSKKEGGNWILHHFPFYTRIVSKSKNSKPLNFIDSLLFFILFLHTVFLLIMYKTKLKK